MSDRLTLDHRLTESELGEYVGDTCMEAVPKWLAANPKKYVKDTTLIFPGVLAQKIVLENDLVLVYNKEYDKHRNDGAWGIKWFTDWVHKEAFRILNKNVTSKKVAMKLAQERAEGENDLVDNWEDY